MIILTQASDGGTGMDEDSEGQINACLLLPTLPACRRAA
jgi:hypothetical protein